MRLSDHRYVLDLRRYDLAMRFIRLEARTQTICRWTGLSAKRVAKLIRDYCRDAGPQNVKRHRGVSPHQTTFFTRTPRIRAEAAILGGLFRRNEVFIETGVADPARHLPGVTRGERLCEAYEMYRELVRGALISFERAVLLVEAVTRGIEIALEPCRKCEALIVVDRLAVAGEQCPYCE